MLEDLAQGGLSRLGPRWPKLHRLIGQDSIRGSICVPDRALQWQVAPIVNFQRVRIGVALRAFMAFNSTRCHGKRMAVGQIPSRGVNAYSDVMTTATRRRAARKVPPPPAQDTILDDLLAQSKRGIVPIRKSFVQQGRGKTTRPGPLAEFVKSHDLRGLEAYLLVHALASGGDYSVQYPSNTWVHALGLNNTGTPASARGAVSKIMKRLADRNLIARERVGRGLSVTLLKEDGQGAEYEHPHRANEQWLRLPYAYWRKGYHESLSLPAKAMLLVALSLNDEFQLPSERASRWYGFSSDTAERGLRQLREEHILDGDFEWERDYRSPTLHTQRWTYTLRGDFAKAAVNAASKSRGVKKAGSEGSEEETEVTAAE